MKKIFLFATTALMLFLVAGCTEGLGYGSSVFKKLSMKGPDGEMKLTAVYDASEDVTGCSGVICHTDGKDVFSNIWLSFYFYDTTPQGGELKLERIHFGAGLSSNSREYTNTFTGKMILGEKTDSRVIIYMDDVHFKIQHGEYILDGNLIARTQ